MTKVNGVKETVVKLLQNHLKIPRLLKKKDHREKRLHQRI